MKKLAIFLFTLLALGISASGQRYGVMDELRADRRKASGVEGPHRFDSAAVFTPSPEGYSPFYIGHYGRHGSRYGYDRNHYRYLRKILEDAFKDRKLTPLGESFRTRYLDFCTIPTINAGDLCELGCEQHKRIAGIVSDSFPEVFSASDSVRAISSSSGRCIMSMASFCTELQKRNPRLGISEISLRQHQPMLAPNQTVKGYNPVYRGQKDEPGGESTEDYRKRCVDTDGICGRIFSDKDYPEKYEGGKAEFIRLLYKLLGGYRNYCEQPIFDDIVTPQQFIGMWEAANYGYYRFGLKGKYKHIPLLLDFLNTADAAVEGNGIAADLRFGHDYVFSPFLMLINANDCCHSVGTAEEVKYWYQDFNTPMAATVLFVLYRSNNSKDILFKLIINEEEAFLPQLTAVSGPYYRWEDFRQWAMELIAEHPLERME